MTEQERRDVAKNIRELALLNVSLATISRKDGALKEACDMAEAAIYAALEAAYRSGVVDGLKQVAGAPR